MKFVVIIALLGLATVVSSQHNLISTHSFFRDKLFETSRTEAYNGNSFLPVTESNYNLQKHLKDTSVFYYDYAVTAYKKHWFEIQTEDCYLTISPTFNFSLGRDLKDEKPRNLFQNTRGFIIEGDIAKNFSFATTFYENQGRFSNYESDFVSTHGEFYIKQNGFGYVQRNGVVAGGTRTKEFKNDGFDYGFAQGYIVYQPHKKLDIIVGNNQQFIGAGYRSMLLSDNSAGAPYLRLDYRISKRWSYSTLRTRAMNLVRKKKKTTVEAYYQPKGFAVNYLSFQATDKLNVSLFEGSTWSMGDSLTTNRVNPLFYNPIPIISSLLNDSICSAIQGVNVNWLLHPNARIYGQFAVGSMEAKQFAFQVGYRGNDYFKIKNLYTQLEYNFATSKMYKASTDRLNYSHYNLALAHPKENGFHEIVVRLGWEWKRMFADVKSVNYFLVDHTKNDLLPIQFYNTVSNDKISHNQLEFGYRINKKLNWTLFGSIVYRKQTGAVNSQAFVVSAGMRTSLLSHYNDY
jgi:hypothetical protein